LTTAPGGPRCACRERTQHLRSETDDSATTALRQTLARVEAARLTVSAAVEHWLEVTPQRPGPRPRSSAPVLAAAKNRWARSQHLPRCVRSWRPAPCPATRAARSESPDNRKRERRARCGCHPC